MIRINLLPWRESRRAERRRAFFLMLGVAAVAGIVLGILGFGVLSGYVSAQENRNTDLKTEIASLEKQIATIKGLQEQTNALLSRKQIIESLQANRSETVHLFNTLARETPEGIALGSIKQSNEKITLFGFAQSNARISAYMRNLDASPLLERPNLLQSQAVKRNNRELFEFSLEVYITRQTSEADKKADKQAKKVVK